MADKQHAASSEKHQQNDPDKAAEEVVNNLKSQGMFDQFRKECIEELENLEAYRLLKQRVENHVASFLSKYKWSEKMSKNSLRDNLRMNINRSEVLLNGADRLVDQILDSKIDGFSDQIAPEIDKYLGIGRQDDIIPGMEVDKDAVVASPKASSANTVVSPVTTGSKSHIPSSSSTMHSLAPESVKTLPPPINMKAADKGPTLAVKKPVSTATQDQGKLRMEETKTSSSSTQNSKPDTSARGQAESLCKDIKKEGVDCSLSKSKVQSTKVSDVKFGDIEGCKPVAGCSQDSSCNAKASTTTPESGHKDLKFCGLTESKHIEVNKKSEDTFAKKELGNSSTSANVVNKDLANKEENKCSNVKAEHESKASKRSVEETDSKLDVCLHGCDAGIARSAERETKKSLPHKDGSNKKSTEEDSGKPKASIIAGKDRVASDNSKDLKETRLAEEINSSKNCSQQEPNVIDVITAIKPNIKTDIAKPVSRKDDNSSVNKADLVGALPPKETAEVQVTGKSESKISCELMGNSNEETGVLHTQDDVTTSKQKLANAVASKPSCSEPPKQCTSSTENFADNGSDTTASSDPVKAEGDSDDDAKQVNNDSSNETHFGFGQRRVKRRKRLISESEDDRGAKSSRLAEEGKEDLIGAVQNEGSTQPLDSNVINDVKPKRGRGRPRKAEGPRRDSHPSSDSDLLLEGSSDSMGPADLTWQRGRPHDNIVESNSLKRQRSVGSESNASETGTEDRDLDTRRTKRQIKPKRCYSPSDGK